MNRFFQWLNLFGVVALAGLCGVQWSINQRLTDKIAQQERTVAQQSDTIANFNRQLSEDTDQLVAVRQQLDISESARHSAEAQVGSLKADRDLLALKEARSEKALQAWIAGSNARDAVIQKASATIKDLSARYAAAVAKYNDLAGKYNQLVSASQRTQTRPR